MTTEEFGKSMVDKVVIWATQSVTKDIRKICNVELDAKQVSQLVKSLSATLVVVIADVLDTLAEVDGLYALLNEGKLSEVKDGN